jgi:hypothetical protein
VEEEEETKKRKKKRKKEKKRRRSGRRRGRIRGKRRCIFVLSCVVSGLATGCSPVQGILRYPINCS